MNVPTRARRPVAFIEPLEARIAPALITTLTWQGDLATNGWDDGTLNTNTNWLSNLGAHRVPADGNALVFPAGAGQKSNFNDLTGLDLKSIAINDGGYLISGNAITLSGGLTANVTGNAAQFTVPITLVADQIFANNGTADLSLSQVNLGGHALTISGTGQFAISVSTPKITGAGSITKTGTGTTIFNAASDYTGPTQVDAGILNFFTTTGLGASGAGNGTTVASGATLVTSTAGVHGEDLTLSGTGAAGQAGAWVLFGPAVAVNTFTLGGAVRLGADATIASGNAAKTESVVFAGLVGAADDALAILTADVSGSGDSLAFANAATFTTEIAGLTPGAGGHDQLKVLGPVDLGGATLNAVASFTPNVGDQFVIVDNDGADAITGTFNGLAEGATFTSGGVTFKISYKGLDGATGNDAVLTVDSLAVQPGALTLSADGKTASYTDVDGDLVTVKTTKGPFQLTDFRVVSQGVTGGGQLQQINLTTHAADFAGAGITITAKPGPLGGNGFVNVGYLNATGIDLGAVKIAGDVGRLAAGTVGGDAKVPGVKSLAVESVGLLGTSTQAAGAFVGVKIQGALPKLAVKGDVRAAVEIVGALSSGSIGGSLVANGGQPSTVSASTGIGSLKIGGDIRNPGGGAVGIEVREGAIGSLTIGGSLLGTAGGNLVTIDASGQTTAPASGVDLAIKSLTVKGTVEASEIRVGSLGVSNADASIGSITVGGDWIASNIRAASRTGVDIRVGTADDVKETSTRDNPNLFSTIGSFTVKGQALGTSATGDMFGVVAERIGKAKVGGRTFAFTNGATPEAFFAAPTGPGIGAESPAFDFTIRELGSTTPTPSFGGSQLDVTSDGKTATFTDEDGDLVTVKRTLGTFAPGDFAITDNASGGGRLTKLTLNAAPGNLTFTAKPGPLGGNGFVNVGEIESGAFAVGNVSVVGDVEKVKLGISAAGKPGTGAFSAHSLGVVTAGASQLVFRDGLGKLIVARDVSEATILMTTVASTGTKVLGSVAIGGNMKTQSIILADDGIGAVKIGGSVLDARVISANGAIGAITVGGDVVGNGTNRTFGAEGQLTAPAKGIDLAIKSLTVKGGLENARVQVGLGNADAAIGAVSVGRAFLASSVLAGVQAGTDTFFGTSDDTKIAAPARDNGTIFASIASISIKGQALGSAAAGDSFGIVAERIGKAKIGTRIVAFAAATKDAFAAAPTGPGAAPDNAASDFFLREI